MTLFSTKPPHLLHAYFFFLLLWRHKTRLRLPLLNVNAFEAELIISRIVCVVLTTQLNCEAPLFVEDMFSFFQPNLMMIYCFHALSSRIVNLRCRLTRPELPHASGRPAAAPPEQGRAGPGGTGRSPGRGAAGKRIPGPGAAAPLNRTRKGGDAVAGKGGRHGSWP